nr:hypothetical protein Iba_chr02bCG13850 [Ipomoea batatas]
MPPTTRDLSYFLAFWEVHLYWRTMINVITNTNLSKLIPSPTIKFSISCKCHGVSPTT